MSDDDRPWEGVGNHKYFRRVMKNMQALGFGPRAEGLAHVRFGRTGEGVAPNYQIEGSNGEKTVFNGLGHSEMSHVDEEFDPEKISEKFSFSQVREMLARVIENEKKPRENAGEETEADGTTDGGEKA